MKVIKRYWSEEEEKTIFLAGFIEMGVAAEWQEIVEQELADVDG